MQIEERHIDKALRKDWTETMQHGPSKAASLRVVQPEQNIEGKWFLVIVMQIYGVSRINRRQVRASTVAHGKWVVLNCA
jgi:hypothetical protein